MKIKCYGCGEYFCADENMEDGYSTICKCPECKTLNSCSDNKKC